MTVENNNAQEREAQEDGGVLVSAEDKVMLHELLRQQRVLLEEIRTQRDAMLGSARDAIAERVLEKIRGNLIDIYSSTRLRRSHEAQIGVKAPTDGAGRRRGRRIRKTPAASCTLRVEKAGQGAPRESEPQERMVGHAPAEATEAKQEKERQGEPQAKSDDGAGVSDMSNLSTQLCPSSLSGTDGSRDDGLQRRNERGSRRGSRSTALHAVAKLGVEDCKLIGSRTQSLLKRSKSLLADVRRSNGSVSYLGPRMCEVYMEDHKRPSLDCCDPHHSPGLRRMPPWTDHGEQEGYPPICSERRSFATQINSEGGQRQHKSVPPAEDANKARVHTPTSATPNLADENCLHAQWEEEIARNILGLYQTNVTKSFAEKQRRRSCGKMLLKQTYLTAADEEREFACSRTGDERPGNVGSHLSGAAESTAKAVRSLSVPQRNGAEAIVMVPRWPSPIWFSGTGAINAEWGALPGGEQLSQELDRMEESGQYAKYTDLVEAVLLAHLRAVACNEDGGMKDLELRLWRQLVVTVNAFGCRLVDTKRFGSAMELLQRGEKLAEHPLLPKVAARELHAFINDSLAYYYLRRGKMAAALGYATRALRVHQKLNDSGHAAKCHLHAAAILSRLGRHEIALTHLMQVLEFVDDGRLDTGGGAPQKLCLVAVCYHNAAVEQLKLGRAADACVTSQNARQLARLCLSYSTRWMGSFEGTHKLSLAMATTAHKVDGSNDCASSFFLQRIHAQLK
jgi:tetratricopeptide (TPR) repeat protein